jgi:dolichyl-phosphate-mannose-protein mannosyltransferase
MNPPQRLPWSRQETACVIALTALGAILRLAHFGRLGLDHFDEGIYVAAGTWILQPGGILDLDPGIVAYSPPGYPFLIGLADWLFGASDFAAILVSIMAGVATIPLVGWLGRRWFGAGFGGVAATFAAFSGPDIVFSRMALTDSTLLLLWVAGIAAGCAFLDRPGPGRAALLGLAVGAAQLTKYNGWLIGAVVAVAVLAGLAFVPSERSRQRLTRTVGWGLLAATIALAVYFPWIQFVERGGGYAALLKHQRSYLGEVADWPRHLGVQLRQLAMLSGGEGWSVVTSTVALILSLALTSIRTNRGVRGASTLIVVSLVLVGALTGTSGWWLGPVIVPILLTRESAGSRMVGAWWLVLTILTPFYHPYARLWLPLEAAGWLLRSIAMVSVLSIATGSTVGTGRLGSIGVAFTGRGRAIFAGITIAVLIAANVMTLIASPSPFPFAELIGPKDDLRSATARLVSKVPGDSGPLRFLSRPTVWYYAAGPLGARGIRPVKVASVEDFVSPGFGWGIVDSIQLRQERDPERAAARFRERCVVIAEETAVLSPATTLDVNPMASGKAGGHTASLFLVRIRRAGD